MCRQRGHSLIHRRLAYVAAHSMEPAQVAVVPIFRSSKLGSLIVVLLLVTECELVEGP